MILKKFSTSGQKKSNKLWRRLRLKRKTIKKPVLAMSLSTGNKG